MTLPQFSEIFALLAVQLRFTDADEATIRGYFKALSDVEPELVAMAAQRFAAGASINSQGEAWFPKAPEWRAMAAKVEKDRTDELEAIVRKRRLAGEVLCQQCEDVGWFQPADGTRYRRCSCRDQRRLEVLGRRPLPALPEARPLENVKEISAAALAAKHVKGMR